MFLAPMLQSCLEERRLCWGRGMTASITRFRRFRSWNCNLIPRLSNGPTHANCGKELVPLDDRSWASHLRSSTGSAMISIEPRVQLRGLRAVSSGRERGISSEAPTVVGSKAASRIAKRSFHRNMGRVWIGRLFVGQGRDA